jgi:hypothetical protein
LSPFLPVSERGNQGTEQISPANLQALNNGNGKLLQTKHEVHLLIPEQLAKLVFGFTPGPCDFKTWSARSSGAQAMASINDRALGITEPNFCSRPANLNGVRAMREKP